MWMDVSSACMSIQFVMPSVRGQRRALNFPEPKVQAVSRVGAGNQTLVLGSASAPNCYITSPAPVSYVLYALSP